MTKANWYIGTHIQTNRVIKNGEGCGVVVMHVYPKEFKYGFKKKNFACHGKHIWKLPAGQACLPFDLARSLLLANEKIGPESDSVRLLWLVGARTKIESRSSSILCRTFSLTKAGFFYLKQVWVEDKEWQHRTKIAQLFARGSFNFLLWKLFQWKRTDPVI